MHGIQRFIPRGATRLPALLLAAFASTVALPRAAQTVPGTINFQGRLTDNGPSQVPANGASMMKFEIYDAAGGGTQLWFEPVAGGVSVPVTNGIFNYTLGSSVAIPPAVFSGATSVRYLQITLNPGASQEILTPRQLLTATGYAGLAQNAISAANADSVSNGVYTTGSYADPAWLASLGGGKIVGTVAGSNQLGGSAAANWQQKLAVAGCPANQFYNAIAPNGTASCGVATGVESDPKVGTLTTGRVPYWNSTALTNGTIFDTGAKIGIGTASPVAPLHVAAGSPNFLGSSNSLLNAPRSVFVQGRYAFVASTNNNALVIFDISNPASPVNIGFSTAGLSFPYSVFVQGRYAFVTSTGNNALVIFDISNPASPANVGTSSAGLNFPAAVYVQGRYAFVASYMNSSLVVFDIGNPAIPVSIGASTAGLNNPQTVYVQGRYAFVGNLGNNALVIFDIGNPAGPVYVGASSSGLNNPQSVQVQGRYAFVASSNNNSLVIFDIGNPATPVNVGATTAGLAAPRSVYVQGREAFVVSIGNNSLAAFDIGNPATPVNVGSVSTGLNSPQSVYVQGRSAFVANTGNSYLLGFDLGGAYLQQLEAGGTETGTLSTRANAQVGGDAEVRGGLAVGNGGVYSAGAISGGSLATPGTLSIGVRTVSCPVSAPVQDCSCAAGESVVSGGGYTFGAGNILRESGPVSATTWRLSCANSTGAGINCNGMNILCDRRAP